MIPQVNIGAVNRDGEDAKKGATVNGTALGRSVVEQASDESLTTFATNHGYKGTYQSPDSCGGSFRMA